MRKFLDWIQTHLLSLLAVISAILAFAATVYCFFHGSILNYGDAESHINIAKRVVSSLTPGLAQLGGIWLPLPHLLMVPFVFFTPLWRTGLAGSIVGGASFVVGAIYIYKLTYLILEEKFPAIIAFAIFVANPNLLYLQSTPMSELPLIAFFILSTYYFVLFLKKDQQILHLIFAAFFGLCATLSRYDGWFLVFFETISLVLYYLPKRNVRRTLEGIAILFSTLAFFGVALWFLWDFLILGDPLYFSNSPFSAKSQQQGWLLRGELPGYKNILVSFLYYFDTTLHSVGFWIFLFVLIGFLLFLFDRKIKERFYIFLLLSVPFIFYWATLFLGQSVIFIPDLTPASFQWRLFNVRYGVMMIPFASFFFAYIFQQVNKYYKTVLISFFIFQTLLFSLGKDQVMTFTDGQSGLSSSKKIDAVGWMQKNYDGGLVLLDDYARTLSIIKSGLPIEKVIYVGNKPYWQESLKKPEKYATWVILQKGDAVWSALYDNPIERGRLFKYFRKEYTSPEILIFKRNNTIATATH